MEGGSGVWAVKEQSGLFRTRSAQPQAETNHTKRQPVLLPISLTSRALVRIPIQSSQLCRHIRLQEGLQPLMASCQSKRDGSCHGPATKGSSVTWNILNPRLVQNGWMNRVVRHMRYKRCCSPSPTLPTNTHELYKPPPLTRTRKRKQTHTRAHMQVHTHAHMTLIHFVAYAQACSRDSYK